MDEEQSTKLDFITIVYWNWNLSKLYSTAITLRIVWRFVLRRVEKLENVDIEVEFDTDTDDNAKTELDVDTLETKRMIMAPHF